MSEAVLYLVAPEEAWKCHAMKLLLIDLLSAIVLKPLIKLLSDPDNINRAIIRSVSITLLGYLLLQLPAFFKKKFTTFWIICLGSTYITFGIDWDILHLG